MKRLLSFLFLFLLASHPCMASDCASGYTEVMTLDANGSLVSTGECEKVQTTPTVATPLDIKRITGQDKATVAQLLGKPACEKSKRGAKCSYKKGGISIVYINGMADWITINPKNVLYLPDSIKALGIPPREPDFQADGEIRWAGIEGLLSVSAFRGQSGHVEYFYVKARTP